MSRCALLRRPALLLVAGAALIGCTDRGLMQPTIEPRVIVHAMLDAHLGEQLVFVEQSQNGKVSKAASVSAVDAVVASGGRPISHATVRVRGPLDTVTAVEDLAKRGDGTGAGIYRLRTAFAASAASSSRQAGVLRLIPGAEYHLEVRTADAVVTGRTRLPDITLPPDRRTRVFNLDTDTLRLSHPSEGTAGYFLRRMLPGFHRSESFERTIAGELLAPSSVTRSSDAAFARWRDLILPGTTQQFSVVALDSNYLRYAVIGADPFGDDVRGNSLRGGVGLFGSVATLTDVTLDLVANREHAMEGEWMSVSVVSGMPARIRLYESPQYAKASRDLGIAFTGSARFANGVVMLVEATPSGSSHALRLRSSVKGVEQHLTASLDNGVLVLTGPERTSGLRYHRQ